MHFDKFYIMCGKVLMTSLIILLLNSQNHDLQKYLWNVFV